MSISVRDQAAVEAFLEMLAVERGAATNTIGAYRRDLDGAAEFLAGKIEIGIGAEQQRRGGTATTLGFDKGFELAAAIGGVHFDQPPREQRLLRPRVFAVGIDDFLRLAGDVPRRLGLLPEDQVVCALVE